MVHASDHNALHDRVHARILENLMREASVDRPLAGRLGRFVPPGSNRSEVCTQLSLPGRCGNILVLVGFCDIDFLRLRRRIEVMR